MNIKHKNVMHSFILIEAIVNMAYIMLLFPRQISANSVPLILQESNGFTRDLPIGFYQKTKSTNESINSKQIQITHKQK
jgi:hypothetical protein